MSTISDSPPFKNIRLTQTVKKGGCAAKLPAGTLRQVLKNLNLNQSNNLLVGTETMDDACAWRLGDGRLMIQTLDFFTPIVDDAYLFGAIAAANSISDIYAMGANPKTALTILAFPTQALPEELLAELMRGAVDVIHESGAVLAGGHTIDDETLKLGFSVTGFVDENKLWKNSGAKPGDVLILTKALGTGTIATAIKENECAVEWVNGAIQSMRTLNRVPELVQDFSIHAATDITGFGLAGHALQMARASGVCFEIYTSKLPVLLGARECLQNEMTNRAHKTNMDYVQNEVEFHPSVDTIDRLLTVDAQTSGGLLLSVAKIDAAKILSAIRGQFPCSSIIGEVAAMNNSDSFQQMTRVIKFKKEQN
jgi:selenide,water dikinase